MGNRTDTVNKQVSKQTNASVAKGLVEFTKVLQDQEMIRLFVDGVDGMGHQASSVLVLRALVGPSDSVHKGLGYARTVEVYYKVGGNEDTLAKLKVLLPELENKSSGKLNNAWVELIALTAKPPKDPVTYAFTGGADYNRNEDDDFTKKLNTKYFLRLQPYMWFSPLELQQSGKKEIDLKQVPSLGQKLENMAYYQPIQALSQELWSWYLHSPDETIRNRCEILQWLIQCAQENRIDLWLLYGVRKPKGCPMKPEAPEEVFVTQVAAALHWQLDDKGKVREDAKSTVLVNLDTFIFDDQVSLDYLSAVLAGGLTLKEQRDNVGTADTNNEAKLAWKNRADYFKYLKASDRSRLHNGGTLADLKRDYEKFLLEAKDHALFLQLGSVPPLIFAEVYRQSTLPRVFEGMGTANLALNLGAWYFHVAREDWYGLVLYPTVTLDAEGLGERPAKFQAAANEVNRALSYGGGLRGWKEIGQYSPGDPNAPTDIRNFMRNFEKEGFPEYLRQIREFYANSENCKLRRSLVFLHSVATTQQVGLRRAAAIGVAGEEVYVGSGAPSFLAASGTTLDQIYTEIDEEIGKTGQVALSPGILDQLGAIGEFYVQLLSGLHSSLVVNNAAVKKSPGNPITWVELTGTTTAPMGPTDAPGVVSQVSARFTVAEGSIQLQAAYTQPITYTFPGVPWIPVKDPFVELITVDATLPVAGRIGATIPQANMKMSYPLPATDGQWLLRGDFVVPPSLTTVYQLAGGANLQQVFPDPFRGIASLSITGVAMLINANARKLEYVSVSAGTTESIRLLPGLSLDSVTLTMMVSSPIDIKSRKLSGSISGYFKIGTGDDAGVIKVAGTAPDVVIQGELVSGTIKFQDLLHVFLPDVDVPLPSTPKIDAFYFVYALDQRSYSVSCNLNISWTIADTITIKNLGFSIANAPSLHGQIDGSIAILPNDPDVAMVLTLAASYLGKGKGWRFEGQQTAGKLPLGKLLKEFLHWETDQSYGIDGLGFFYETQSGSWEFTAKTAEPWQVPFIPDLSVAASFRAGYNGKDGALVFSPGGTLVAATPGHFARLETEWNWLNSIQLKVWFDYNPDEKSFGFTWKALSGTVSKNQSNEWIGKLTFDDNVTLGSMIEDMVSWITGSRFGLESPWNFLNSVKLSNLSLIYNFTKKTVEFGIDIGPIDLGFARIDSIQVGYGPNPKTDKRGVMVSLKGSFPWNVGNGANGDDATLGPWDASQPGTAPAPSGNGNKYLDLRMLAMGQHVHVTGLEEAKTVQEAIDLMKKLPDPPDPAKPKIPPVTFDPQSAWLFGTDFGVLRFGDDKKNRGEGNSNEALVRTGVSALARERQFLEAAAASGYLLTLQIIFNDPTFYALRVKLDGESAKIFKGLDFQILYRQVGETVGVYQSEITLPDVMRHLSIGVYSITLPIFGIAVYTNGDFQVDVGFPWNANFARSFTIEGIIYPGIPVIGSAGFYFGKLSSATTNRVPQTTLGTFNPVIVFGFGLQVGFGKSIEYGVLKAGFSLTVVGILEGVIAKWNPFQLTDGGSSNNAQLQGAYYFWLQGTVGIIGKLYGSVDFAIIKASVNVELKLLIQLTYESYVSISVTVLASVDVSASVEINLGIFSISIHFSFSMRLKETFTMLNSGQAPWQLAGGARGVLQGPASRRLSAVRNTAARLPLQAMAAELRWSNLKKPDAGPLPLYAYMAPAFTVACDEWASNADPATQVPCYVAGIFMESTAPTNQDDHSSRLKALGQATDTSFETLCKTVLRWAVAALQSSPMSAAEVDHLLVTGNDLERLNEALVSSDSSPTPVPESAIDAFLTDQFRVTVQVPPAQTKQKVNATYFPMAPQVRLVIPPYGNDYPGFNYAFNVYNAIDSDGLKQLRHYFDDLAVQVQQEMQNRAPLVKAAAASFSMSDWIYTDYFLLLARQMVQAAREALRDFKYPIASGDTGNSVVNWINTTGQLADGNAYTLSDLFTANRTHILNADAKLTVGVTYAINSDQETFTVIAQQLYGGSFTPSELALANADNRQMLRVGAKIAIRDKSCSVQAGDTLIKISRVFNCQVSELVLNAGLLTQQKLLASDSTIFIPLVRYQSQSGNSFEAISQQAIYGGALTATDLATQNAGLGILRTGAKVVYPGGGVELNPYVIRPRDCLGDIANYFGVSLAELLRGSQVLQQTDLLAGVAVLFTPPFVYPAGPGDQLQTVASRFATTVDVIAAQPANGEVADLFAVSDATQKPDPYLDIPHLAQFRVGELIAECQRSLSLQHLSSVTSRYYLHGLRLPTEHIKALQAGMWTRKSGTDFVLPTYAGLYALTGQQFPLPLIQDKDFVITLDNAFGPAWLEFNDDQKKKSNLLRIAIAPESDDAKRIHAVTTWAHKNRLDIGMKQLGSGAIAQSELASYPFASSWIWQSAAPVELPYSPAQGAVPALKLWRIPDAMLNLFAPASAESGDLAMARAVDPRFKLQIARYDEATGSTQRSDTRNYGWASVVEFTIKRIPEVASSPASATTYEIVGAGGKDIVLLEQIIAQAGNNPAFFNQLLIGYAPVQTGNATYGIQTDPPAGVTMGIAQVDLSTETRPFSALRQNAAVAGMPGELLNSAHEFITLLWEASIVRSGGFYLYYYSHTDGTGLPDRIFNDRNEATLSLIVLYAKPSLPAEQNTMASFMNVVVTGDNIDSNNSTLFAQADPPPTTILPHANASLATIAYAYYSDIGDLAGQNSGMPLVAGTRMVVDQGVFQAPPEGMSLAAIAQRFSTQVTRLTVDDIRKANPQSRLSDPLLFPTAIKLPQVIVTAGTDSGRGSLGEIAAYYGQNLTALAATNQGVAGLFAATEQEPVQIPGGPRTRHASVPPGVLAVEAVRPVPPPVPDKFDDPDYGKNFLLNLYTLLNYQIAGNDYFKPSKLGLPAGPTAESSPTADKIRRAPALGPNDFWYYKQSFPYPKFVKTSFSGLAGLPPVEDNPYRALGNLLQVNYTWQDNYGNTLVTVLSDPKSGDAGPLNQSPMLTGYTDLLINVNQWPAVSASWQVMPEGGANPELRVRMGFDTSKYEGMLKASARAGGSQVVAEFTEAVDQASAADVNNYSLDHGVVISLAVPAGDGRSVTLTTSQLGNASYTLTIRNIKTKDLKTSFSGDAGFDFPDNPDTYSSSAQKRAMQDLHVYTQLFFQLTDPNGVACSFESTLFETAENPRGTLPLTAGQLSALNKWLFEGNGPDSSIYAFLENRSLFKSDVAAPPAEYVAHSSISPAQVNPAQVFELSLSFSIARTAAMVAGELQTTSGVRMSSARVVPRIEKVTAAGSDTVGITRFAQDFQDALSVENDYRLKIATGVDRLGSSSSSDGNTIWAVRVGWPGRPVGYQITEATFNNPQIFAPQPVSNHLRSEVVEIYDYTTGKGISQTPTRSIDFVDIDVDIWVQQFFSDVDSLLTPQFTAPMQIVGEKKNKDYLGKVLRQKKTLAGIAKRLMIPAFAGESGDAAAAQEIFYQQMLIRLANAYTVRAAMQFAADVDADIPHIPGYPPQLYGNIIVNKVASEAPGRPENEESGEGRVSFTAPRLALEKNSAQPLAFLLSAPDTVKSESGAVVPAIQLDLTYNGTSIEHQIGPVPGIQDYHASTWLNFVIRDQQWPLQQPLGEFPVPMFLRAFPASPAMMAQEGDATYPGTNDLPKVRRWNYAFTYSLPFHYPQDVVHGEVEFNLQHRPQLNAGLPDAFPQLAEFITVFPAVNKDLQEILAGINAARQDRLEDAAVALHSFCKLVEDIITAAGGDETTGRGLAMQKRPRPFAGDAELTYKFQVKEGFAQIDSQRALRVSLIGTPPPGVGTPRVLIDPDHYDCIPYTEAGGDCDKPGHFCFVYQNKATGRFLSDVDGQAIPQRQVVLEDMDILARQDALSTVFLKRNEELIAGKPSADPFIYQTPDVQFANTLYPAIESALPISLVESGAPKRPLEETLQIFFHRLFAGITTDTVVIQVEVNYEYSINAGVQSVTLPLLMQPPSTIILPGSHQTGVVLDQMIAHWARAIELWFTRHLPDGLDGVLWFDLAIMSHLTDKPMPLLRLRRLYLAIDDLEPPLPTEPASMTEGELTL